MRCKKAIKILMSAVLVFSIGQLSYAEGDMAQIGAIAPDLIILDSSGVIRFQDYGGGPADKDLDCRAALDFVAELLEEVKGE